MYDLPPSLAFHHAPGLQPDAVTHYILLSTCIRLQSWCHVEWLLEDMHSKGVAARTPIYLSYMRELCSSGDWNKAVGLFCAMQVNFQLNVRECMCVCMCSNANATLTISCT
jgi:pentatricopeptide repeat protein